MRDGFRNILPVKEMGAYQLAPNEAMSTGAINRVLEHLLKNDDLLKDKLRQGGFKHAIVSWARSGVYNPGDLVCYIGHPKPDVQAAYILLCIATTHTEPLAVLRNDLKALEEVGWKLVHENTLYLIDSDLLRGDILKPATDVAILEHETEEKMHDSTVISTIDDFSKLFLKNDLSNYMSPKVKRQDGTDSGSRGPSARFGVTYEFSNGYSTLVSDGVQELEITFSFDPKANQDIEILNPRYFHESNAVRDKSDAHIFGSYYGEDVKTLALSNGLVYENIRVPGTNVFSKVIEFEHPFTDSTYMVFQSSYLPNQFLFGQTASDLVSRTAGNNAAFVGNIMFVNKTPSSITAILPIHVHFAQYGQYVVGVPWVNEFKINVVGVKA